MIFHSKNCLLGKLILLLFLAVLCPLKANAKVVLTAEERILVDAKVTEARKIITDAIPSDHLIAENLLIEAIRIDPYSVNAFAEMTRYILWQIAVGLKPSTDIFLAQQFAEQVRTLAPGNPIGAFLVGETLVALNRTKEAQDLFKRTVEQFPNDPQTNIFKARFYSEINPQYALEAAEAALRAGMSSDLLSNAVSHSLSTLVKEEDLGERLLQFASIFPDRWIFHKAGLAFTEANKFDKAQKAFEKAIEQGNELESRLQLALLAHDKMENFSLAITLYKDLLKRLEAKNYDDPNIMAGIMARLALAELADNKLEDALATTKSCMTKNVMSTNIIQAVMEKFAQRNLSELLEGNLQEVIEKNPFFTYAHAFLGDIKKKQHNYHLALKYYSNAITLAPEVDEFYSKRGHVYYEIKKYENALNDFNSALKIKPDDAISHYNRACMLALLGKPLDAFSSLKTALILDNSLIATAKADPDLTLLISNNTLEKDLIQIGILSPSKDKENRQQNAQK